MKLKTRPKRKKGFELAINYVFLFFIALIVTTVVISMIMKGYINASRFTCKLTGTCESEGSHVLPNWRINVTDCGRVESEIIKEAALCYQAGIQGEVRGPCYVLLFPSSCNWPDKTTIHDELWNKYQINASVDYTGGSKVSIGYNYDLQRVVID